MDPFYGINYVNRNQELLGYQQLLKLTEANTISIQNLKHVEIEKFYFDLKELQKGWNTDMVDAYISDMRRTYAH